jgi:hypothetical protein
MKISRPDGQAQYNHAPPFMDIEFSLLFNYQCNDTNDLRLNGTEPYSKKLEIHAEQFSLRFEALVKCLLLF